MERSHQPGDETRFVDLFERAGDGIFVITKENRFLDVNARACEMLGYTRTELLQRGVADVLFPRDRSRLEAESATIMGGQTRLIQ